MLHVKNLVSTSPHSAARSLSSNQFNDAADFDLASYEHHPVEDLEPLPEWPSGTELRRACIKLMCVLESIDTFMNSGHAVPTRWIQVSIALGLHSTAGMTETEIAGKLGISRQAVSRGTVQFLRMVQLPPSFGLKSEEARRGYQQTNGRHEPECSAQSDA